MMDNVKQTPVVGGHPDDFGYLTLQSRKKNNYTTGVLTLHLSNASKIVCWRMTLLPNLPIKQVIFKSLHP